MFAPAAARPRKSCSPISAAAALSNALVSSGPKVYGKVTLPDPEVLSVLKQIGAEILRTDERDAECPVAQRIGGDTGPGGCDSYVISIAPTAR